MAKATKSKSSKQTPEEKEKQQKEFALKQLVERLPLIPEPTYAFNVGDRVEMGNLKDVYVFNILNDGKIYEIDYTSINNNYGNPIISVNQKMYVAWFNIRKFKEYQDESIVQNRDIKLNYFQSGMGDIFSKAYHFGINFEPEYQREFVWNLEDKVSLIDSIFSNVDIGKFTFLHYDDQRWTETGFGYEIIDGKQRLRAILDFYEDRFAYKGKLFSELSHRDRSHFKNYPVMEAELHNLTREQILRYFIMLNMVDVLWQKNKLIRSEVCLRVFKNVREGLK